MSRREADMNETLDAEWELIRAEKEALRQLQQLQSKSKALVKTSRERRHTQKEREDKALRVKEMADKIKQLKEARHVDQRQIAELQEKVDAYETQKAEEKEQVDMAKAEREARRQRIEQEREVAILQSLKLKPEHYASWTSDQIVDWILSLDEGRYKRHEASLRSTLCADGIDGQHFGTEVIYDALDKAKLGETDHGHICKHVLNVVLWEAVKGRACRDAPFKRCMRNLVDLDCVKKVLVVAIGISEYDESTGLDVLEDVPDDLAKYHRTFHGDYGYPFVSNKGNALSYEELNEFLVERRQQLIAAAGSFDALLLCVCSHGNSKGIVCSDGLTMHMSEIRSIFGLKQLENVVRLYAVDACRQQDDEKHDEDDMAQHTVSREAEKLSVTLRASSEGCEVTGGMLAEHLTAVFSDNLKKPLPLGSVLKAVEARIEAASNAEQAFKMEEGSPSVLGAVFRRNDRSRGGTKKSLKKSGDVTTSEKKKQLAAKAATTE